MRPFNREISCKKKLIRPAGDNGFVVCAGLRPFIPTEQRQEDDDGDTYSAI